MASSCNKLMMEAIDIAGHEFKGIELNYKLDEVLGNLKPSMKFTAEQLKGYLLKQGVSPNEIKASKMFEGFETDNRALPISDWVGNSGKQVLEKRERYGFDDITLGGKGSYTDTYKVNEFMTTKQEKSTNLRHRMDKEDGSDGDMDYEDMSQLGWNRVHQDTINGKPTTVLNELQSDWMQAERQGAGTFESKMPTQTEIKQANELAIKHQKEYFTGKSESYIDQYHADWMEQFSTNYPKESAIVFAGGLKPNIIADFPLKPEKFQQLMIVDALNEAITNGTNRVAIPTIRHDNELVGTEGVTKFYQDLNKKVLPDIRKKLEKQGIRVKVSSEDYGTSKTLPVANVPEQDIANLEKIAFGNIPEQEARTILSQIIGSDYFRAIENSEFYPYTAPIADVLKNNSLDMIAGDLIPALRQIDRSTQNKLHILEIEEVPNTKVKWDVYGLLSSIGLGAYAINSEANTTLESSIIANKRPIETNKMSNPIVEEDKPVIMQERPIEINPDDYKDTVGGVKGYIANIESRQAEGIAKYNLKNPNSSALGKYQFTDDMRKQLFKDLKMTPKDLKSPVKQEEAMTYLIGVYKDRLEKWDLPVNKENMFIVHNLGTTGGIRALRGTYTDTDILNMRGNLPEYLAQSTPYEVVKNYSMYYNVDIPITRTLKSMEDLPPKNVKK